MRIIEDWADNDCFFGKEFISFDAAEDYLCGFLDDRYDEDRQEYYIIEKD